MPQTGREPPAPAESDADPSMEDILASIRRILNDDGEAVAAEPQAEPGPAEDVFELDPSMIIDEPTQPAFEPDPPPEPEPEPEGLMATQTAAAAGASMNALVRVLGQRQTPVYRGGPTLEDVVRDEIRPLVKNWLDEHLPPMVERLVRAEIERVTNRNM